MDNSIIKTLLNHQFYLDNKHKLSKKLFSDEIEELYELVVDAHSTYKHDLSSKEIFHLWKDKNPTATRTEVNAVEGVIQNIENSDSISEDIASHILEGLWKREIGRKIAQYGIELSEGREGSYEKIKQTIELNEKGFMPDQFQAEITKDLEELLEVTSADNRFKFNINSLQRAMDGIGPMDFGIIFARPETGKTAFVVSLACAPGGFCDQGARVFYGGNEEDPRRTMVRAFQACSGMTKQEILINPQVAIEAFEKIKNNISMMQINDWTLNDLEVYLECNNYDIAIIDQLDKLPIVLDKDMPTHEKLKHQYSRTRSLGTKTSTGIIGVSQASFIADGKTIITPDMMENSRTGKYAEADFIIGVGKQEDSPDGSPNPMRYLTIGKNKITGVHGTVTCKLEAQISRYVD